jgi:UDP-glucose 4-epimerase
VPLFVEQVSRGGPVTITLKEMTRFLLSLDRAVDTVFAAIKSARRGETYVPKVPAARVIDVAEVLIGNKNIQMTFTGIRPGEKIHEIMVSEDECYRTVERGDYYVICPMLPELQSDVITPARLTEYSSSDVTLDRGTIGGLLAPYLPSLQVTHLHA